MDAGPPRRGKAARWLTLGTLLALVAGVFFLRAQGYSVRGLHGAVRELGHWGPVAWVVCLWVLLPFMAPVSVLTALGGLAFGPWVGLAAGWVGVVGGGWIVFWISRAAGRGWVERLLGHHAARLDPHLEAHGFFGTLYLRMLPLPFVPVSYLAGLTRIRFLPYAAGTALGIFPGVLVNAVVAGTVGEMLLEEKGLEALLQPSTLWAGGVVAASLVAPFLIEGVRRIRTSGTQVQEITRDPPDPST